MTRTEIRKNFETIITTYNETHNSKPSDTVAALVDALGYDPAVVTVAELVNTVGDWDLRISDRNREWAGNVTEAASRDELREMGIYTPSAIHPAHIDQIADAMRKYEPETAPEAPAEEIPEEETETAEETAPEALQLGDVVEISGAYFKNDNGLYFVTRNTRAVWRDLALQKIGKTGKVRKNGSNTWPLRSYCSDRSKSAAADAHNAEHAQITRATVADLSGVAEWFRAELSRYEDMTAGEERRGWTVSDAELARLEELRQACARFDGVEAPEKKTETGIRFYWNGIKVDGGELIKCGYSAQNDGSVTIYAHGYGAQLPREYFTVRNDTDLYTDYFDTDRADVEPDHPLYKYVRYAAMKAATRGDRAYIEKTRANIEKAEQQPQKTQFVRDWIEREKKDVARRAARLAEFDAMKDPGQPTAADLEAVEAMKTAAESARIEAEKQAQIEERERVLKERVRGREFIEAVMDEHPVADGEPVVEITDSELPAFYSWTESRDRVAVTVTTDGRGRTVSREEKVIEPRRRCLLSVSAADIILKHFDEEVQKRDDGYYKTYFTITWKNAETGDEDGYEGRYDIGDGDGGLVAHVRMIAEWDRDNSPNDDCRRAALERIKTADFLAGFLPGGRVVKVELAPWAAAVLEQKRQKEAEARERFDDTLAAVEMLTDEQLIHAVNLAPYADPEKRDVGRFFLQQLAQRDEKKALDVFRRWVNGEEAPLE